MEQKSGKWNLGLKKSRKGILEKINKVFSGRSKIDDSVLEDLEEALIEADVGTDVSLEIVEQAEKVLSARDVTQDDIKQIIKSEIAKIVNIPYQKLVLNAGPEVILVAGVNGTGKTTTIGKLAAIYKKEGKKVLLAGADTFRAAAAEQLHQWAKRTGADVILQKQGADPASVAFDSIEAGISRGVDVVIIDTAGRLQNKVNLMEELRKIHRVIQKKIPDAPHEVLLVIDATTGQNGLLQAKIFTEAVGVTGIVLTKLDGTAKGGIVVAICKALNIPVKWVGLGEGVEDLVKFDPEVYAEELLGD